MQPRIPMNGNISRRDVEGLSENAEGHTKVEDLPSTKRTRPVVLVYTPTANEAVRTRSKMIPEARQVELNLDSQVVMGIKVEYLYVGTLPGGLDEIRHR